MYVGLYVYVLLTDLNEKWDNYATAIMCNERKLFTNPLTPTSITLETAEGLTIMTKLVGALRLVLTNDSNEHHTY